MSAVLLDQIANGKRPFLMKYFWIGRTIKSKKPAYFNSRGRKTSDSALGKLGFLLYILLMEYDTKYALW